MPDPSWNLTDDECTDLSGWTQQLGGGDLTCVAVTYDSRACFRFSSSGGATSGLIIRQYGAFTAYTAEITFRITAGYKSNSALLGFFIVDNANYLNQFYIQHIQNSGLPMVAIHYNGYTTHNDIIHWVDGEYASWHTARIVCAGSGSTAHLFIDGAYYGSSAYGSGTAPTSNNVIEVVSYAQGVASTFYVDKIRLSSTQEESTIVEPIRINGVDLNARLSSHTYGGTYLVSGSFNSNSGVRFVKGVSEMDSVIPYCLPKVATGDSTASKVRIRDNSTTYALQGWPALP